MHDDTTFETLLVCSKSNHNLYNCKLKELVCVRTCDHSVGGIENHMVVSVADPGKSE